MCLSQKQHSLLLILLCTGFPATPIFGVFSRFRRNCPKSPDFPPKIGRKLRKWELMESLTCILTSFMNGPLLIVGSPSITCHRIPQYPHSVYVGQVETNQVRLANCSHHKNFADGGLAWPGYCWLHKERHHLVQLHHCPGTASPALWTAGLAAAAGESGYLNLKRIFHNRQSSHLFYTIISFC